MARIWLSFRPAQDPLALAVGAPEPESQLPSNSDTHRPILKDMDITFQDYFQPQDPTNLPLTP